MIEHYFSRLRAASNSAGITAELVVNVDNIHESRQWCGIFCLAHGTCLGLLSAAMQTWIPTCSGLKGGAVVFIRGFRRPCLQ